MDYFGVDPSLNIQRNIQCHICHYSSSKYDHFICDSCTEKENLFGSLFHEQCYICYTSLCNTCKNYITIDNHNYCDTCSFQCSYCCTLYIESYHTCAGYDCNKPKTI